MTETSRVKPLLKRALYWLHPLVDVPVYQLLMLKGLLLPDRRARILYYHNIGDLPKEKDIPYDNVPSWLFERQMGYLKDNKYNVISLDEFREHVIEKTGFPRKTVIITFDDGFKNVYKNAYPVLRKFGFSATVFLVYDYIGTHRVFDWLPWDKQAMENLESNRENWLPLSWEEVREMSVNNISFGSHTLSHRSVGHLSTEEASREIQESRSLIEDRIGRPVRFLCYPYGSTIYGNLNKDVKRIACASGYWGACTSMIGASGIGDDLYALKRIPIREDDGVMNFRNKLGGAYDWVNLCKVLYQKTFPAKIDGRGFSG